MNTEYVLAGPDPNGSVIVVKVEKVRGWRGDEPKPQTAVYQNTPEDDNPPVESGIVLDHSWREVPVSPDDRVGIYLGGGLVVTAKYGQRK